MKLIKLVAAVISIVAATSSLAGDKIEIDDAWIRHAAPGMGMTAGYMKVENETSSTVSLTGARSKDFGRIELHRTEIADGGMARMIQQKQVEVPAGKTVEFRPKGLHLMMYKPARELKPGERVMVELQFSGHPPVMTHFTVRAAANGMEHGDHGHMNH